MDVRFDPYQTVGAYGSFVRSGLVVFERGSIQYVASDLVVQIPPIKPFARYRALVT